MYYSNLNYFEFVTIIMTLIPCCSGYSVNCRSDLVKQEIRKCTKTVHDFQDTQVRVDGNRWLEPNVSKELNAKCDDAMVSESDELGKEMYSCENS